jgi:hypothetical protein
MTEPFDYLDKLARRARQDHAPQGDVSQRILHRLAEQENRIGSPMVVFAAGYAAVASVALVYGYVLFGSMTDPLLSLFHQAATEML